MASSALASQLDGIGNTPLVELKRLPPKGSARVLVKLESKNPSGSSKDRSALAMITGAETRGDLRKGMRIVEASGGSTGTSLAMISAIKGYDCTIVLSDAFSDEKLKAIAAYGAKLDIFPSAHGKTTYPGLYEKLHERVHELAREPGNFFVDQTRNPDNPLAFYKMGEELVAAVPEGIHAFVMSCGSGGCFSGTMAALRARNSNTLGIAVEPLGYRHISGGPRGSHRLDGIGDGPPGILFRYDLLSDVEAVSDEDAYTMARRLAKEEGIFGGKSAGANVVGALRTAARLGEGSTVVSVICDSGYKYLSGDLFA